MTPAWAMLNRRDMAVRFWPKVRVRGPRDCWLWRGAVKKRTTRRPEYGYIQVRLGGRAYDLPAHRVSVWLLEELVEGLVVRHGACNNSLCVNPAHLTQGTHAQNMRDMVESGRSARGRRNGNHRSKRRAS